MQTVDATAINGHRWSVSDRYGLLSMVGGVGGDFSPTDRPISPIGLRLRVTRPTLVQCFAPVGFTDKGELMFLCGLSATLKGFSRRDVRNAVF